MDEVILEAEAAPTADGRWRGNLRFDADSLVALNSARRELCRELSEGTRRVADVFSSTDKVSGGLLVRDVFQSAYGWCDAQVAWTLLVLDIGDWKTVHVRDLDARRRSILTRLAPMIEERIAHGNGILAATSDARSR